MLTLLKGPPASGKSTLAKEMQVENPKLLIVSRDAVRELLVPEHRRTWYTREDRKALEKVVDDIVTSAVFSSLEEGYDVVLDETNPDLKKWKGILDFLSEYEESNHVLTTLTLDTPIEECIRRDAQREYPVGESVIRRIASRL